MSLSNRTQIYRSGNKLGLSPSDIDGFLNRKVSVSNVDIYKSGNVGTSDVYKAGTHYGTVSADDIYKAGTMYASVSPEDF